MKNRDLIKRILTEEVNEQKVLKGIKIIVNSLKQEYPYIIGWELSDGLNEYKSTIYINLIVSYEDAKEFYGLEPRYEKFLYLGKLLATPISPFKGRYDNEGVEEALKMNEYVEEMYEYVPDELKMNANMSNLSDYAYYKVVKIDYYKFVDETTN